MFDRFYRGSNPVKDDGNHLGLGLAIAKRIVELHGSELRGQSVGARHAVQLRTAGAHRRRKGSFACRHRDGIVMSP